MNFSLFGLVTSQTAATSGGKGGRAPPHVGGDEYEGMQKENRKNNE